MHIDFLRFISGRHDFPSDAGPSSESQGQPVGLREKAGRKFSSTGERVTGYRLSPNYFQNFKRMLAPD